MFASVLSFGVLLPGAPADTGRDEARLQNLRARIHTLEEKLNDTRGQRDTVRDEVRDLERRIGVLLNDIRQTESRLRADENKLSDLRTRAARERGDLAVQRQRLARQVYTAYAAGREEYAKMLLNQKDPGQMSRVLVYYRYLNRARTERIAAIQVTLSRLASLDQQIREHSQTLEALQQQQREQKAELERARSRRGELLASLNREVRDRSREIERLRADEKRLERLLEELKTVLPEAPLPPGAAGNFSKLRGRLPLPTRGRILARYGEVQNMGSLRWRGLLIGGREGQDVIAVFPGRVVYADWLRGFGLLLILEHGDGYMTLYGHNQSLHKGVGDWVEAGEVIASLGSTGDVTQPELYFEIRHNGEPRDPLIWCKAR
ncbi:MAG TPA: peptidoglycan DD-metalloendopeptidase family protein [Candidatus Methylomirabilis sp.]|nr:peptidoglycan DD-metalloendopeptidase family protein [Candidatus Methylomirabilis sp.]